jgi:hypothetical protein
MPRPIQEQLGIIKTCLQSNEAIRQRLYLPNLGSTDSLQTLFLIPYSKNPRLLLELEAIILRTTEPPCNVQIPMES